VDNCKQEKTEAWGKLFPVFGGRICELPAIANGPERGIYAASSFASPLAGR
jgi:hypothetical protein